MNRLTGGRFILAARARVLYMRAGATLRCALALGAPALARLAVLAVPAVLCAVGLVAPVAAATPPNTPIVNVATSRYVPGGSVEASQLQASSNTVVTVVAPAITFEGVVLSVAPEGSVVPGTLLSYTLVAENRSGIPLTGVVLRLPLDPNLGEPLSIGGTPGVAPAPTATSYDPLARVVTWTFASVPDAARLSVQVAVAVLGSVAPDTLVQEAGDATAVENPQIIPSNTVVTPVVPPVITVIKRAERTTAVPGDPVPFALEARNTGDFVVSNVQVVNTLPDGLAYIAGSGRLDGAPLEPAVSSDGRTLRFAVGALDPGAVREVRLAVRVTARATEGDAVNRAMAEGTSPAGWQFGSASASASVRIVPGPFRREAIIAGRVFVDDNADGLSDRGEPGVPGVLVTLEDGRGAVTDVTGRWHVEGVRPGLHVVRIDPDTLPPTLRPVFVNADWAADAGSRFVETRPAALAVIDLPVGPGGALRCRIGSASVTLVVPSVSLLGDGGKPLASADFHLERAAQLLIERSERDPARIRVACVGNAAGSEELTRVLREKLAARGADPNAEGPAPTAEARNSAADATAPSRETPANSVPPREAAANAVPSQESPTTAAPSPATPEAAAVQQNERLEDVVRAIAPEAAILSPSDGSRARTSSLAVEVAYPIDATPELRVNGSLVPTSRIGVTSKLPSRGVAASRYVGVPLVEGQNRIEFRALPAATGDAPVRSIVVWLPGRFAGLVLSVPESRWVADSVTPGVLRVEATDGAGIRVAEAPFVTLTVEGVTPLAPDADRDAPGYQVRLDDGQALVRFAPAAVPGRRLARAVRESIATETWVDVIAPTARWRILGLAEARIAGDAGVEGDGGGPPGFDDDPLDDGGRLALTARGPVGQASRLTVSVDTEREPNRDELYTYYEPDRYFPVYGDTSLEVNEAERQGKVFARIDGPRGFAQYGITSTGFDRLELARYDRRLEGASGRATFGPATVEGFAASTEQTVVRDVFAPDGTSGPYLLSRNPVVARSERVFLELRDRERTDEVLRRQVKLADLDYDLDTESGTILFRGPVAPYDAEMNPFRVVVLYEARGNPDSQVTAGTRVSFRTGERVETGVSLVREQRAGEDLSIYGGDVVWRAAPGTTVRAELAATDEGASAETASVLEVQSRPSTELGWDLTWRDAPIGFANPTLLGAPEIGSRRYGGRLLWDPSEAWHLRGESFRQEDEVSSTDRTVAGVDAERRLARVTFFGGLKSIWSDAPSGSVQSSLAEVGARGRLGTRVLGELGHRQVLSGDTAPGYPTRTAAGIAWEITDSDRLVLRQEIESGDGPTHNRTSLGVESRIGANTSAFARYELAGGATGPSLRSTTGVETVLPLRNGIFVNLFGSRVHTTEGSADGDFTTVGAGFEQRFGDALFSGRYELNLAQRETRHVATASGAFRFDDSWTAFVRERIFVNDAEIGPTAAAAEGLVGFAFRPEGNPWQALVRLDHTERGGAATTAGAVVPGGVPSEPTSAGEPAVRPPGQPGIGTLYDRAFDAPDQIALNVATGAQITARQRLALTGIVRFVAELPSLDVPSSTTHLLGAHYTAEIRPRWTLGGSVRRFAQNDTETSTYGAGIEVGWLAVRNLWITGGYNVIGFRDPYASSGDRTEQGPFFSIRFKFDERSLTQLDDLRLDRQ